MVDNKADSKKIDLKTFVTNTVKIMVGLLIAGIGTSFMFGAGQGSAPAATITEGMAVFTGLSYGLTGVIINVTFLVILFVLDKGLINVGTILATFFFGYFIDVGMLIVGPLGIVEMGFVLKTIMMLIGCILTALGLGYYIGVDFGSGALDGMSIAISKKFNVKFTYCRWTMDTILMIAGVAMGASWGIGTVAAIVLTGPIMSFVINRMKK